MQLRAMDTGRFAPGNVHGISSSVTDAMTRLKIRTFPIRASPADIARTSPDERRTKSLDSPPASAPPSAVPAIRCFLHSRPALRYGAMDQSSLLPRPSAGRVAMLTRGAQANQRQLVE
jgi:hypothetical protein